MAKTIDEKILETKEKIAQLENQKKQLIQKQNEKERKARNHRFCKRMGLFESLIPEAATLTDEQFKTYLEKTLLTGFARKILNGLLERDGEPAAEKTVASECISTTSAPKIEGNGEGNEG